MRLEKEVFEKFLELLKDDMLVYSRDGMLFCGKKGTEHEPFFEPGCPDGYLIYATIYGKTLPVEHGMCMSLIDESRSVFPEPKDHIPQCFHVTGQAGYYDIPLEILAHELPGDNGAVRSKWDIWMLRDPKVEYGHINDRIATSLAQKIGA